MDFSYCYRLPLPRTISQHEGTEEELSGMLHLSKLEGIDVWKGRVGLFSFGLKKALSE